MCSRGLGVLDTDVYLEVRRLADTDVDAVLCFFEQIVKREIDRTFHPHPFDAYTAEHVCSYDKKNWYAGCFRRNTHTDQMVGYVMLRGWDEGYAVPSLGICVLPDYQGCGIGGMLMSVAILVARFRGSPAIRLKVYPDNNRAIALYRRMGFEILDGMEHGQLVGYLRLQRKMVDAT
ncbi:MAG: GNAT family N-acetyltransferase [Planctomycetota bacterium]|jgi:ribosomal protein S18 acetylase RimI-like enzyme